MIEKQDFEEIFQSLECTIKDEDNTQIHMNQIFLNEQGLNDYKNVNLKQDQTVHPEKESEYHNIIFDESLFDYNSNFEYVVPNLVNANGNTQSQQNENETIQNNSIQYPSRNYLAIHDQSFNTIGLNNQQKKHQTSIMQNKPIKIQNNSNIYNKSTNQSIEEKQALYLQNKLPNQVEEGQESQLNIEKVPVRLMKSINLLVNVKGFYRQLTKNSRIFEKITQKQQQLIGDLTARYKKQYGNNAESLLKNRCLNQVLVIFYKIQSFIKWIFQNMMLFQPNHSVKRLWDAMQAISIIYFIYLISLVIFFSLKINDYSLIFQIGFIHFLIDMIFTFNTAIIEKGNVINSRQKIAIKYLKGNFIFDVVGLIPFLVTFFELKILTDITSKLTYGFIIFKISLLSDILDSLSFYFSFQKNKKNLVDLFKVIFLIISVCHIFSILWHGLALYEITVLERDDTWINTQNLLDADVYIRYIYSFYFLAVTMQTVGYGDITPKNPIEITFTIITMFCTGMIWAFSLNSIGNIIENINKGNKDYKNDMELIHCFMIDEAIDSNLRVKVSNYLEYLHKESNEAQKKNEKEIICKLSKQLQLDLAREVQGKFLKDIPILRDFASQKTQLKLIPFMEEILFSPGENIFKQYDVDDSAVYYIVKGSVQLLFESKTNEKKEHIFQELFKKQYFGEISFITGQVRGATARASDFCRLFKIKREQFIEIIKNEKNDYENFQMVKEAITLKNNLKFASIRCFQCNQGDHLSINCPKTQLTLTKQIIIRKHNFSVPIKERQYQARRNNNKQFQSLLQLNYLQEIILNIHNNPEQQQYLIELEKIFLKPDEEMEQSQSSSSQSDSDSDTQSSNSQKSIFSSPVYSEQDAVGSIISINKQNKIYNNSSRKSSIFATQQSQSNFKRNSTDLKPNQAKENLLNSNNSKLFISDQDLDQKSNQNKENIIGTKINKQIVSELDFETQQLNIIKKQNNCCGNSQPQISIDSQYIPCLLNSHLRYSLRRKSSQNSMKQEDMYNNLILNQGDLINIINDDTNIIEIRKIQSSQNLQMIDKYQQQQSPPKKQKDRKKNSQQNINTSNYGNQKEKDKQKHKDPLIKIRSRQYQNNIKEKNKSLAFSQVQNLMAFQQNNNITSIGNHKDLHPYTNQVTKQLSYGSSHNLNKIFTSQMTQNDQRTINLITYEEMNRKFDKLFNFKIYYPHNNSTEILAKLNAIIQKNSNKLISKTLFRFQTNVRKLQKKGIQALAFNKDLAFSNVGNNSKQKLEYGNNKINTQSNYLKRYGQSYKNLQLEFNQ